MSTYTHISYRHYLARSPSWMRDSACAVSLLIHFTYHGYTIIYHLLACNIISNIHNKKHNKHNHGNTYLLVIHATGYLHATLLPTVSTLLRNYSLHEATPELGISFLHKARNVNSTLRPHSQWFLYQTRPY